MAEQCTEYREQRLSENRVRRQQRYEERSERCRRRDWWDPRSWFCWIEVIVRYVWEWVTEEVWVWVEWVVCVVVEAVNRVLGSLDGLVGMALGRSQIGLKLRFTIVSSATDENTLNTVPVPEGAYAELVRKGIWIFHPVISSMPIHKGGSVDLYDRNPSADKRVFVRVLGKNKSIGLQGGFKVKVPITWDSKDRNYFHQQVQGVDCDGETVPGIFNINDFPVGKTPVIFTIEGLPVHVRVTNTGFLNFRGDPGDREHISTVPAPSGLRIYLCKDGLISGFWDNLIKGRTGSNGEWHTVLHEKPRDLLGNPMAISTQLEMNLKDTKRNLGPINVYEGWLGGEAGFISRLIRVSSDPFPLSTPGGHLNALSYGTIDNPVNFDIERAQNVGITFPGAEPLGSVAVFALQAIVDVHSWFRQISENEYEGFEFQLFMGLPQRLGTSWSSPLPEWARMNTVFIQTDHFDVHSVIAHEFCHQISYRLGLNFGHGDARGLGITGILTSLYGEMVPYHDAERRTTHDVALIEGWAEFIEGLFGRHVPLVQRFWTDNPPASGMPANLLWDENVVGERIEGCVAHALFRIYNDCYRFEPCISLSLPDAGVSSLPLSISPGDHISGYVFNDSNTNGTMDANESILRNLKVAIYDFDGNSLDETETDENGNFHFENTPVDANRVGIVRDIHAFNPTISFINPILPTSTSPINISGVVSEGDSVEGEVFNDHNNNTSKDEDELSLRNSRVAICDSGGGAILETETNENGMFEFESAPAGSNDIRLIGNWLKVIPAVLSRRSNIDFNQANLKILIPNDIPGDNMIVSNVFKDLFFKPWVHPSPINHPRDIYIRMMENAHQIGIDLYEQVRNTFIQHNMLLPTVDVSVDDQASIATAQLVDVLGHHISGVFDVAIMVVDPDPPVTEIRDPTNADGSIEFPVNSHSRFSIEIDIRSLTGTPQAVWVRA